MKPLLSLLLCFVATLAMSDGQVISAMQAREILSNSLPVSMPPGEIDPKTAQCISRQISAIEILRSSSRNADTTLLIPYLSYPHSIDEANTNFVSPMSRRENIDELKAKWLAFDVILSQPNAGLVLSHYSVNGSKPTDMRIAAMMVLAYKNRELFNSTLRAFANSFTNETQSLSAMVTAIESGHFCFEGIPYLDS